MKNENENENENGKENKSENDIGVTDDDADRIDEKQKRKEDDNRQIMKAFGLFTQLGVTMVSCILIGFFLGLFLDKLIGTAPLFMIIFLLMGVVAAIKALYDISKDWK